MSIHESGEDYLETILILEEEKDSNIRSIDIAKRTNHARASISKAMKKLKNDGYIIFNADDSITLTVIGRHKAEEIYKRHQNLTEIFIKLGVDKKTAEQDACKLEHDLSCETYQALLNIKDKL